MTVEKKKTKTSKEKLPKEPKKAPSEKKPAKKVPAVAPEPLKKRGRPKKATPVEQRSPEKKEEKKETEKVVKKEIPQAPPKPAVVEQPVAVVPKPVVVPVKPVPKPILPKIKINELTTVREIAEKIAKPASELIKKLMSLKIMATINQKLDQDIATILANEFGYDTEFVPLYSEDSVDVKEDPAKLNPRAPIVTVMGHVDHGKTTLLDTIRKTKVTEKEHGGITQHIGAYRVHNPKGDIVFLDTPGHEAFTAMRAHGTKITDIVVLVVAADDGIMPQTIEAIDHARSASVPIIVAVNKIDLAKANPQIIKQQLAQHNLVPDDWGGDTMTVEISARNNINIDKLIETILFKAELMELKANPNKPAQGIIIESQLNPQRGPIATVLVQGGTLSVGDAFVSGMTSGKVRAMINEFGSRIQKVGPSTPVEILGFSSLPQTGDKFVVVKDERLAKEIAEKRQNMVTRGKSGTQKKVTLEDLATKKIKQLNIILKTDVHGSYEAIRDALARITHESVEINIVHMGVGAINESDVNLAIASDAIIIGFNIRPDPKAEAFAEKEGIDIRIYRIIYELISDIKKALSGLLEAKIKEVVAGHAEVRKTFVVSKVGTVAGCMVTDGKAQRIARIRVLRDNVIIWDGNMNSLKRFKDDVKEVEKGYECGVFLENYNNIKVGDIFEFYVQEKVKQELSQE
ncbi:MAG: translation initiation factor IF-2 [Elusimicrobia bacterium]|nr:translation initiation factor IF-2 [Elusimicrobiota bacterium]MBU2614396.1 translation initiation factor IF-2 [Elusimicrobiota bacterium]